MQINVNSSASASISEQIRAQVAESIAMLELRAGDLLTPIPQLAEQLVASPAAVERAYRALESEGLCRRGERGFEVAPATLDQQRERARMRQLTGSRGALFAELDLARKIQGRLMPPPLTESDGYAIAARVHAAEFVSGDFYDVLRRSRGVVDAVVADVSGKGIGASLIMAFVKARLPLLPAELPVAEILRRLNAQLYVDLGRRQFVAMAYARFAADSGKLEVANAGLPHPYLLRPGRAPETVSVGGPSLPLGARAEVHYRAAETELEPGDRFLLYSDGIPEMPTAAGEPLGYRALSTVVSAYSLETSTSRVEGASALEAWLDGLLDRIADASDRLAADDQTALVLERRGD